jgi:predicted metal-binding membrane protein
MSDTDMATMEGMADMADMVMPAMSGWTGLDLVLLFAMWAIMMLGMMAPAAAPMILLVAGVSRRQSSGLPMWRAVAFAAGYFVVWTGFGLVATLAQWGLHAAALLSPMMHTTPFVGGLLLLGAGLFQWTPLKKQCLVHCRSPLSFLLSHWRDGSMGALAMGTRHGMYCVGCCWMLMALLFVVGVMNLLWVAAITAFVFIERLAPKGDVVGRLAGAMLVMAGIVLMLR